MAMKPQLEGASLERPCWRLTGNVSDHSAFFRTLPELLPPETVVVLEGGRHPEALRSFFKKHEVAADVKVAAGTAWPRQPMHHLPATAEVLRELADLTEHCAAPEVCEHLHAYGDSKVLLQWYDAFSEPLYVSKRVPTERLERFCAALGLVRVEADA